jgi:hypothetical protein
MVAVLVIDARVAGPGRSMSGPFAPRLTVPAPMVPVGRGLVIAMTHLLAPDRLAAGQTAPYSTSINPVAPDRQGRWPCSASTEVQRLCFSRTVGSLPRMVNAGSGASSRATAGTQ